VLDERRWELEPVCEQVIFVQRGSFRFFTTVFLAQLARICLGPCSAWAMPSYEIAVVHKRATNPCARTILARLIGHPLQRYARHPLQRYVRLSIFRISQPLFQKLSTFGARAANRLSKDLAKRAGRWLRRAAQVSTYHPLRIRPLTALMCGATWRALAACWSGFWPGDSADPN
jgi:hypothetical protein